MRLKAHKVACGQKLAYFMSRIRIDAPDVNDVLPPNGAQILV